MHPLKDQREGVKYGRDVKYGVTPVFTKGLRLSQVLGLNVVVKLRLLSQQSFVLKPYLQRVT